MASVVLKLDRVKYKYVRRVEHIFDVVEKIGGFKESLYAIIIFLVFFFQERLFKSAFFKEIY